MTREDYTTLILWIISITCGAWVAFTGLQGPNTLLPILIGILSVFPFYVMTLIIGAAIEWLVCVWKGDYRPKYDTSHVKKHHDKGYAVWFPDGHMEYVSKKEIYEGTIYEE